MIYEIKDMSQLTHLYQGWQETLIWSCLDGSMGRAFAPQKQHPASARIITADFSFLAGKADRELAAFKEPGVTDRFMLLIPQSREWEEVIETAYGADAEKITRYATKKEPDIFDRNHLKGLVEGLSADIYELRAIDRFLYRQIMACEWSADLCSQFRDYKDYERRGLASVCCARLILECLDRNLYPSWDAHTPVSLSLALKLGYHFDKEYTAYQVQSLF